MATALTLALPTLEVRPAAGAAPRPGWDLARVRFEALDPAAPVGIAGLGSYRGALEVRRTPSGLAVVNDVALEDYLLGISEMPPSWPIEAQRAQAVAARTYAAHEARRPRPAAAAADAHLCATDSCQVYVGLAKERREGAARWRQAVQSTAGLVLTHKGEPILAKYSSTNGGTMVAGGRPYLRAGHDPDDAVSPYHRWRTIVSFAELTTVLQLPGPMTAIQRAGDLVEVRWELPEATGTATLPAAELRARLNASLPAPEGLPLTVPSIWFDITVDPATLSAVIDGRGWGHAIGMSQYGALGKALRGLRAEGILAAYYGGLRPAMATTLPARLRVLLDDARAAVELAAEGRFRVLDEHGAVIAVAGAGRWRVAAGGRGLVRVSPPPDQSGPPQLTGVVADPPAPAPGQPVDMRFRLSAPASVRVSVEPGDGGPAQVTPARVLDAGDVVQPLDGLPRGQYVVTVHADAGGGRAAAAPVGVQVRARPVAVALRDDRPFLDADGWSQRAPRALATLLLTALLAAAWAGRGEVVAAARVEFGALRGRRGA